MSPAEMANIYRQLSTEPTLSPKGKLRMIQARYHAECFNAWLQGKPIPTPKAWLKRQKIDAAFK